MAAQTVHITEWKNSQAHILIKTRLGKKQIGSILNSKTLSGMKTLVKTSGERLIQQEPTIGLCLMSKYKKLEAKVSR